MVAALLLDEPEPGRLHISGEIDTHTAPALADRLGVFGPDTHLEIDLTDTTFISSAGLSTLLAAAERLEGGGGSLRIAGVSETVERLIELSGLADRFPLGE